VQATSRFSRDARLVEVGRGALLARKVAALGASRMESVGLGVGLPLLTKSHFRVAAKFADTRISQDSESPTVLDAGMHPTKTEFGLITTGP
jgi:hypothetical protein